MAETTCIFESALVETNAGQPTWHNHVAISFSDGLITNLETDVSSQFPGQRIPGVVIPAIANVHSHAFQRGFAGLSEYRTAANDSFWTWRKLMYDFVEKLTPDDVYVIARQLYLEMLVAGYSWVGEFHYLHNQPCGATFDHLGEMSDAVVRAAQDVGIGICLLPVLYQRSGFGAFSAESGQQRFVLNNDQFQRLLELNQMRIDGLSNATMGVAIHSLRAVEAASVRAAIDVGTSILEDCPIHIHVAEQTQEIEDCLAATGKRSVEYLFSEFEVDSRWCLIHATHLTSSEEEAIASSGAVVGLCPTTEANLGDGFFPADTFLDRGGKISVGSDSHCTVDVRDELRMLEYGQRLQKRQRAVLGTESQSVGRRLYQQCAQSGGQAIGVRTGTLAVGNRADWIVIDPDHPTIAGATEDHLLDRFVFTSTGSPISMRYVGGIRHNDSSLNPLLENSRDEFTQLNRRLLG